MAEALLVLDLEDVANITLQIESVGSLPMG